MAIIISAKPAHKKHLGTHLIAEFFGCKDLDNAALLRRTMKTAASDAGATILDEKFHKFTPQGLTGYMLLKESHISIHTWPEYGYAAIDVFTCGKNMKPRRAVQCLKKILQPESITVQEIMRGDLTRPPLP